MTNDAFDGWYPIGILQPDRGRIKEERIVMRSLSSLQLSIHTTKGIRERRVQLLGLDFIVAT